MLTLLVLAWRNLWRNKRRTWITVFSVVFAVFLAMSLESVDRGSQEQMVGNVVGFSTGYIRIQDTLFKEEPSIDNTMFYSEELEKALLKEFPAIDYLVPRIESHALAAGETKSRVVLLMGIDPGHETRFNDVRHRLRDGSYFEEGSGSALIGQGLAQNLELGVGDTLVMLGQGFHGMTAAGKWPVGGIIHHPVPELNEMIVYLTIEDAQWFFMADDRLTSLMVTPRNPSRHKQLAGALSASPLLNDYSVYTWEELQPELVRTIAFDQAGTKIFLLILYVVIAFGIFGTVLTMTLEREREFGMLISLGLHRWKLGFVVFVETLIINGMGVLIGALLSLPVILYFYFNPIGLGAELESLMAEYGMDAVLPFSLDPRIFTEQGTMVFFISMVIVAYPLSRIMTLNILDASRK